MHRSWRDRGLLPSTGWAETTFICIVVMANITRRKSRKRFIALIVKELKKGK
jgi:hypothetical protein